MERSALAYQFLAAFFALALLSYMILSAFWNTSSNDLCFLGEYSHIPDAVAYVRFASVYREFKDVETFMSELQNFLKK